MHIHGSLHQKIVLGKIELIRVKINKYLWKDLIYCYKQDKMKISPKKFDMSATMPVFVMFDNGPLNGLE